MNYQQIDAERIRKVKERQTSGNNSGNIGYSQTALNALAKGQYSNLRNNKQTNDIPKLNGMSPVSIRKNTVQKTDSEIDTTRARQSYAKEIGYKPIGRSLSERDSDIIHSAIGDFGVRKDDGSFSENSLRNVARTLGWQPDREDELKKKYGKSTLDIVKSAADDWDKVEERKKKTFGEENPIMSTITSLAAEGIIKPLAGLASVPANMIAPDSEVTKVINSKSRGLFTGDENLRSGATNDMGDFGKTVYNAGVDVGGRIIRNSLLTPAASGFATAEQTRQSLEDRGITGRSGTAQAITSGAVDALLDVYGLEKIKGIKALQGSGNVLKTILGSAVAGGGEQAITSIVNEAIDRVANGQDSIYSQNIQNYMAQGMSEEDARNAALTDEVKLVAQQTGQGALFGSVMGGGRQVARQAVDAITGRQIPSLFVPEVRQQNPPIDEVIETARRSEIPEIDNAIRQSEQAAAEIDRLRQQIPEVDRIIDEVDNEIAREETTKSETPKEYKIDTVNRKGGKKGYYVAEETSDGTQRNAETGKVYKTEAEAQEALQRLQGEGKTSTAKVADMIDKSTTPEQKQEAELARAALDAERMGLEPTVEEAQARENVIKKAENVNTKAELQKEKPKTVAESKSENPRYKAPLEGEELTAAKEKVKTNQASVKELEREIADLEEDKSNYWRGNLKKAVQAEIKAKKAEIKSLKAENTATNKQIKGGIAPVKELIDKRLYDRIYNGMNKTGSIYKDINYATKFAGDTPEAKNLAKELRRAIDNYVENPTTDGKEIRAHFDEIITKAIQLDEMAQKNNADYANTNHNEYFWQNDDGSQSGLAEAILMNGSLDKIRNFHKSLDVQTDERLSNSEIEEVNRRLAEDETRDFETDDSTTEEVPKVEAKVEEAENKPVPKVEQTEAKPKQPVPEMKNNPPEPPKPPKNNTPEPPQEENSISKRYETLKKSDLFQKSEANMKMLETAKEKGVFNKDVENRVKTQQEALDDYVNDPEKVTERNLNRQWDSGKDVDTSMIILHDALNSESQAYTNLVLLKQAQQAKKAGRQLRAYRDYTGTKEDTLQKAGQYLNDKADDILSSRKQREKIESIAERVSDGSIKSLSEKFGMDEANVKNIADAIGKGATKEDVAKMIAMYQATGKTGVSSDALNKIKGIYDEIEKKNLKPNSKARAKLEADAFKVLADDIGGKRSLREQWNAWRYLAMLGNPKTHLRNILGNTTHRMVTEAKDNVGAVLEEAVNKLSKKGIDRTKALLNVKDAKLINAAAQDADDVSYGALNDMGNKYNVKTEIDRARNSFNSKLLSKIDDLNSNALDVEDYSALKKKYSRSLARYLKANGANEGIFNATDDASKALLDKGRTYAIDQAKQATFHEYSKMAESLNKLSKDWSSSDKLRHKASAWMLEGLVPFKKTPINILKQGAKYSPISLAKAVGTTIDAVKTGNSTASDAIEDLASGLTGSGILALGAFLAHEGLLTGSADKDYDVDNAQTEQGAQNYALKIGDKSYTLDWLAPMSLPLFVGVEAYNQYKDKVDNNGKFGINDIVNAITTIGEPITEMSMLQGVNDALETLSYNPAGAIGGLAASTLTGYVTQGVPTLAGQFSRAIDKTRRSTYSDKIGAEKQVDKTLTKTKNKIPFLSELGEPFIDASGKEQKNENVFSGTLGDNIGTRLMDQMLSPGYYKKGTITAEDKELNRLYKETGKDVYKNTSSGEVNDVQLSKEDYTKYQKLYGSNTDKLYKAIINSSEYKSLDDAEKVKALENARSTSKMIADHEIGGKELKKSEQKTYDIYKEKGIDGLVDNFKDQEKANQEKAEKKAEKVEAAGGEQKYAEAEKKADALDMSVNTYLKKEKEYEGGAEQYAKDRKGADELGIKPESYNKLIEDAGDNADKVLNAVPELKRNGLANTNAYHVYAHAIKEVPSLTTGEFVKTFNEIDTDNSKGIKQKELLAYLDNRGFDDAKANEVWNTYGDWTNKAGQRKKIKRGKNGKWTSYY